MNLDGKVSFGCQFTKEIMLFSPQVIVFPDKDTTEALPEGIVEIDVDAGSEEISSDNNISMDQPNQLPIVTTFLAPNKVS